VSGPDWIWVLESGVVTGVPIVAAESNPDLVIKVTDAKGATATATILVGKNETGKYGLIGSAVVNEDNTVFPNTRGLNQLGRFGRYTGEQYDYYWSKDNGVTGVNESNYNAKFDQDTGTLTLRGYEGSGIALGGPETSTSLTDNRTWGDGIIYLIGDNTITVDNSETNDQFVAGITSGLYGNLVITGDEDATLTIKVNSEELSSYGHIGGGTYGISSTGDWTDDHTLEVIPAGKITICGNITVNIEAATTATIMDNYVYGIRSAEETYILQGASVNISAQANYQYTAGYANALFGETNIATSGDVRLKARNYGTESFARGSDRYCYAADAIKLYDVHSMKAEWQPYRTWTGSEYTYEPTKAFYYLTYDDSKFVRITDYANATEYLHKAHATISSNTFKGSVGKETVATADVAYGTNGQFINVKFTGIKTSDRADASAIRIKNLPAGLEQSTRWIEGTTTARICVYGTPTKVSSDQVEVEIWCIFCTGRRGI